MKKPSSLITYIAALVIGIILLCFHGSEGLSRAIVNAIGILITVPSGLMLISFFVGRKNVSTAPAWYTVLVAIAGLVLGIWMLCMPKFFIGATIYTLGVILILVGAAGVAFIMNAAKPYGANPLWYIVPFLSLAAGFIVIFIGPQSTMEWIYITSGVVLIVYAANGIGSLGRECKVEHEIKEERRELIEEKREERRDERRD